VVQYSIYKLRDKYRVANNPNKNQIKSGLNRYLGDIDMIAGNKDIKVSIMFVPFSYENGINDGIVEYQDILNTDIKNIKQDWEHQEDVYQAFFEALKNKDNIERVIIGGYWWDDAMDPKVKVRISISPSPRNKKAEAVVKNWFNL
jgi:hypothetical protein